LTTPLRNPDLLNKTQTPQEKEILEVLRTPQPVSLIKLSKLLGKDRKTLAAEICVLTKKGLVKTSGKGKAISYSIARDI
jgi:predicted transcriptional regulator